MDRVLLQVSPPGIATLTLNDPDRRNAMGLDMASAFSERIDELRQRTELRAVIITGAGSAFAAGGDLEMLRDKARLDGETNRQQMRQFYRDFLCILDLPVPIVAAVNGHAIGAGFCLALACEARVIATNAKLGLTFSRLGLHPGMGATCFLPRIAGMAVASDLLISGRVIDTAEAHSMGLANQVVAAAEVVTTSHRLAESFLASGPQAVAGLLATLRPTPEQLDRVLQREASEQSRNYASVEFLEGVAAAIEKRRPRF